VRFCILPIASVHIGMIALPSIQSRTTARTADYAENRRKYEPEIALRTLSATVRRSQASQLLINVA
jgi:hypothetical protein